MSVRRIISAAALIILVLAIMAVAAGCGGEAGAEVHVVLTEDSAEWSPTKISSGHVTFLVENETAEERMFGLVFFDGGTGEFQEDPYFVGDPLPGGASEEFSVHLKPGQYGVCNGPMQGDTLCTFNLIAE